MQSVASRRLIIRAEGLFCVFYFQLLMVYPIFVVSTNGCIVLLDSDGFNIKISVPCGYEETTILRSLRNYRLNIKSHIFTGFCLVVLTTYLLYLNISESVFIVHYSVHRYSL